MKTSKLLHSAKIYVGSRTVHKSNQHNSLYYDNRMTIEQHNTTFTDRIFITCRDGQCARTMSVNNNHSHRRWAYKYVYIEWAIQRSMCCFNAQSTLQFSAQLRYIVGCVCVCVWMGWEATTSGHFGMYGQVRDGALSLRVSNDPLDQSDAQYSRKLNKLISKFTVWVNGMSYLQPTFNSHEMRATCTQTREFKAIPNIHYTV